MPGGLKSTFCLGGFAMDNEKDLASPNFSSSITGIAATAAMANAARTGAEMDALPDVSLRSPRLPPSRALSARSVALAASRLATRRRRAVRPQPAEQVQRLKVQFHQERRDHGYR